MRGKILFTGRGIYEPHFRPNGELIWLHNYDGNPFVGVQVDSHRHAEKFADPYPTLEEEPALGPEYA